jgi:hypothetical protein
MNSSVSQLVYSCMSEYMPRNFEFTSYYTFERSQSTVKQWDFVQTCLVTSLVFAADCLLNYCYLNILAEVVIGWFATMVDRVWSQIKSCGVCGGQSGTGAGFLRVLYFPLPVLIPPNAPYSSISQGSYNRPISGWRTKWTQSQPTPRNCVCKPALILYTLLCVCYIAYFSE